MQSFEMYGQQAAGSEPTPLSKVLSLSAFEEEEWDMFCADFPTANDPYYVKPDMVDSMIAQEMTSLSMTDREKVYSDVHGVSATIEETPELVRSSLDDMQAALDRLDGIPAYHLARAMDPAYVQDENFRLMFLRADFFDAKKAAERLGRHFETKLELFGKDFLTKTVTQDCLDQESLHVMYSGRFGALEERDSAGRLVIVNFVHDANLSVLAKLRAAFYGVMVVLEDLDTQRRGCVAISFTTGQNLSWLQVSPHRREWNLKLAQLTQNLPIRFEATHICHDSLAAKVLLALFKFGGGQGIRLRMRDHFGSREECLFKLQTFGIPTHGFPLDESGRVIADRHVEKMEKRRNLEQLRRKDWTNYGLGIASAPLRVCIPGQNDVLFGRGKASYRHMGNLRLRAMVEENAPAYEKTNIAGKQRIREQLISVVHESAGRFLRDDGAGWVEVPDVIAGQKVAHAFRTLRGLKAAATKGVEDASQKANEKVQSHASKRGRSHG